MVKGIHPDALETLLRRPAVPALPHGRRAELHLVQPRGIGVLEQQPVGDVVAAGGLQPRQQPRRADEAGREVPVLGRDLGDKFIRRLRLHCFRQQAHGKRQRETRLAALQNAAVRLQKIPAPRGDDFLLQGGQAGRVGVAPDGGGHLGHQPAEVRVISGVHHFLLRAAADVNPVAVAAHADDAVDRPGLQPGDVTRQLVKVPFHDARVAVNFPELVGAEQCRVPPRRHPMRLHADRRRGVGKRPVRSLRIGDERRQPALHERRGLIVVQRRAHEKLRVARPAEPLVALRAIGGGLEVVALLPPDDVVKKLVHPRIGAAEFARAVQGVVHDDARDGGHARGLGQSVDLHVAKTMHRTPRLERFLPAAAQPEHIGGRRAAEIGRIQRAVGIQHFAVAHNESLARGAADFQPRPADHVLAEIKHVRPRPR